jgi:hypothetical protein
VGAGSLGVSALPLRLLTPSSLSILNQGPGGLELGSGRNTSAAVGGRVGLNTCPGGGAGLEHVAAPITQPQNSPIHLTLSIIWPVWRTAS